MSTAQIVAQGSQPISSLSIVTETVQTESAKWHGRQHQNYGDIPTNKRRGLVKSIGDKLDKLGLKVINSTHSTRRMYKVCSLGIQVAKAAVEKAYNAVKSALANAAFCVKMGVETAVVAELREKIAQLQLRLDQELAAVPA